jgi:hypothetical protein
MNDAKQDRRNRHRGDNLFTRIEDATYRVLRQAEEQDSDNLVHSTPAGSAQPESAIGAAA